MWRDERRRDKLGEGDARHGVYGVILSENKSLLLLPFLHDCRHCKTHVKIPINTNYYPFTSSLPLLR